MASIGDLVIYVIATQRNPLPTAVGASLMLLAVAFPNLNIAGLRGLRRA